jgi:hypothetical protein
MPSCWPSRTPGTHSPSAEGLTEPSFRRLVGDASQAEAALRPRAGVVRLRTIPDERLGSDVHLAWPGNGAAIHERRLKQLALPAYRFEHAAPQQILDVAFDHVSVGERQAQPMPSEHLDTGHVKHEPILPQWFDRQERLRLSRARPIRLQLGPMQSLAFEDTWHWGPSAEATYAYLTNTARHEGRVPDKVSTRNPSP